MAFPWLAAATAGSALLGAVSQSQTNSANAAAAEEASPAPWDGALGTIGQQMGDAQSIYNQQGFAPDPNALQLLARQNALGYGENTLPGQVAGVQNSFMQGMQPGSNPYVPQMIQAAQNDLIQDYQRVVMPGIGDAAGAAGGYGGSRHGIAQGIASEGLVEGLGDISTQMLGNAYNTDAQRQASLMNLAPGILNLGLLPSDIQAQVGGQYQQDALLPAQNLQGYNSANSQWTGINGASAPAQQGSVLGAALGGGLAGYGLYDHYSSNSTAATTNPGYMNTTPLGTTNVTPMPNL